MLNAIDVYVLQKTWKIFQKYELSIRKATIPELVCHLESYTVCNSGEHAMKLILYEIDSR